MIPYILFALIASTTFADTWLADGQALGSGSAGTVSELTFDNGVQLVGSSNGVAVLVGTNTFPLLKEGDVPPPDLPVFDDYSIVDQPTGAKGVAPRYDLNDALFAWHISQLESATIGMVDSWFWSPDSVTGLASLAGSTPSWKTWACATTRQPPRGPCCSMARMITPSPTTFSP
jgi:hypothetical protein